MKRKLTVLLILTLCFFTAFSQRKYPIQTMFKGDSVVILKYNQAVEINNLLSLKNLIIDGKDLEINKYKQNTFILKDTIKNIKWNLKVTQADLSRKLEKKSDSLIFVSNELTNANKKIEFYKGEMKRIEKLEWIEKKTRTQVKIGIVGVLVTWITLSVLSMQK